MPPTTESIADKPQFNVYGTMVILTCLITLGAALIIRQDLVESWGWDIPKEDAAFKAGNRATHITQMNDDPEKYQDIVKVTKTDLDEWQLIKGKNTPFPVSNFQYPEGYDPLVSPVQPGVDNLTKIPEAQRNALMKDYSPGGAEVPKAGTEAPKTGTEAPKPDEKKEPEKKEETKAEEKKAPEAKKEPEKKE